MEEICAIKELFRIISEFESRFEGINRVSVNEAMILCILDKGMLSASEIARQTGLSNSNASKVLASAERKYLIERKIGKQDKRNMYFALSDEGRHMLSRINQTVIEVPEAIRAAMDNIISSKE